MRRVWRTLLLVTVGYLSQVCIMPYLAVLGITPNLLFALIAVVTVAYSKFYTFGMACTAGILTEVMTGSLPNLYLIAYPAIAQLGSLIFSDKSERRLEQERSQGRLGVNRNPYLRTLLCVAFDMVWFESIHLMYIYLSGVDLGWLHFGRAAGSVAYTCAVTVIIMLPVRKFLGLYSRRERVKAAG